MANHLKSIISSFAFGHGFDAVGFAAPDIHTEVQKGLRAFLNARHHGEMQWMEDKADRRMSPRSIWPEVKSVIVLGQNYAPAKDPMEKLEQRGTGNISCYAQGADYHEVIKKKLKAFARALVAQCGGEVKVFVDTAPVMEKPLAAQAGLGWQGKHTCLVSRDFGSWLFLGEVFTTLPLAPDPPETDHCGTCKRCLDICPTQAFTAERKLDARRCISYLTIEYKGHIPLEFRKPIGNRIYGCDDCLAVCPWNKYARTTQETAYHPHAALESPPLAQLATLDDAAFRTLFAKSPVKRIGRDRFIRNVLIAMGNSGDPGHIAALSEVLHDNSPLVRAMAVWALSQLATPGEYSRMKQQHLPRESDRHVAAEWQRGINP